MRLAHLRRGKHSDDRRRLSKQTLHLARRCRGLQREPATNRTTIEGAPPSPLSVDETDTNDDPEFSEYPVTGDNATEDTEYNATLAGSASDDDAGDTLTYSKISGPAWLSVAGDGTLTGTTDISDMGPNVFTIRVTDLAGGFDETALNLVVSPLDRFGIWMTGYSLGAGATDDSDEDSIPNAIEFIIGGNPANQPNAGFLPTVSLVTADSDNNATDEDYLLFTDRRTDLASKDYFTGISVEWAVDPAGPGRIQRKLPAPGSSRKTMPRTPESIW